MYMSMYNKSVKGNSSTNVKIASREETSSNKMF